MTATRPTVPPYSALRDHVPPGSSWGLFTEDPERGMANFAGPTEVLAGVATVDRGAAFDLDHPLDAFDPPMARARRAPRHELLSSHSESRDDVLHGFYPQAGSQVDGLRHRRASGYGFYNGVPDEEIRVGGPALGVQRWAEKPIVGRGVLIDVEGLLAAEGTPLDHRAGPALEVDVLDRALAAQGESVRPGDLVLVHTGWTRWFLDADADLRAEVRDARRATGFRQDTRFPEWLWDHRVALFATDLFAVEVLPVVADSPFLHSAPEDAGMMHQELIAKLGAPLGELWNLTALAADSRATGRWDALVVVKPLHLTGGVGSPANATALR
ncbi:cyclase family protein [Pseudonocardia sp. WMMC193]|uniref:cyclase family protein n=1 Tax=Pseudonocardia sp. WMMC193 TaxID=2911965 RepID=UPI001F48BAA7|nr:cyclase family protein [Pseudonocardia sp. WMMC193]MCF7550694.1 cyclase family protein [Pseudonocardia sp. WMMC193]